MSWSLKFLQVGDTALRVHVTFFLLLLWIATLRWQEGPLAAAEGVLFVLLIFTCVILHEFGHVVAAQRYGIRTPTITVLPIGGVAHLERMPERPSAELVVAIAGPLVNVAIALALYVVLGARFEITPEQLQAGEIPLEARLLYVNVLLVVFNLVPAFPLDGGRIFRALLGFRLDRARATRIAARTGQGTAVLFAVIGIFYNPFLLLIAIFMFFAAEAEASHETMRADTTGHTARDAMITRFETLAPDQTAEDAGRLLILTTQQEFPVLGRDGRLLGMVTRKGLIEAMQKDGPQARVGDFMVSRVKTMPPDAPLEEVMTELYQSPARAVAVGRGAQGFDGYVSAENANELFMLERARRRA